VRKRVCRGILPARFCPEDEVRNKRKRHYLPVKLADGVAYLTLKGSGLITSIAHADGLVAIGEDVTLPEGEVDVRVL
jgi:molybdopterin biosynthesis enzyme